MLRIQHALGPKRPAKPVSVCVAGGAALHIYTGARISKGIDAKVMARVLLDPQELQIAYRGADGYARLLYFDTPYSDSFALLHQDAYDDALPTNSRASTPAVCWSNCLPRLIWQSPSFRDSAGRINRIFAPWPGKD